MSTYIIQGSYKTKPIVEDYLPVRHSHETFKNEKTLGTTILASAGTNTREVVPFRKSSSSIADKETFRQI